jgi:hypothetical protein
MDYNIILPSAGRSTRFPTRPKWSLTMPSGQLMLMDSLDGLRTKNGTHLYIGLLHSQTNKLGIIKKEIISHFNRAKFNCKLFTLTDEETSSHAHTAYTISSKIKNNNGLFIKDVDNKYKTNIDDYFKGNCGYISVIDANETNTYVDNKSTVLLNKNNYVTSIKENNSLNSNIVCVGGYSFPNKELYKIAYDSTHSKKISDIINHLISNGTKFKTIKVEDFIDFGTYKNWKDYKNKFATLFLDLDGVLVTNGSEYFKNQWKDSKPIIDNINCLYDYNFYIIITSSRPEKMRDITAKQLQKIGVRYDELLLGLPSCKRIVINDKSNNNSTDTSFSINLDRNSDDLAKFIHKIMVEENKNGS